MIRQQLLELVDSQSLSELSLSAVVVKLRRVRTVVLWLQILRLLAEHNWQVILVCIAVDLADNLTRHVSDDLRVQHRVVFLALQIVQVVSGGHVARLKCLNLRRLELQGGGSVAQEQVMLHATLVELHILSVVLQVFLGQDHFLGLWLVLVGAQGRLNWHLGLVLSDSSSSNFLYRIKSKRRY